MTRIAHLTSAHPWNDVRIFVKECRSLAHGFEVFLIAPGDFHEKEVDGVKVRAFPRATTRLRRFLLVPWRVLVMARQVRAQIYHFHDPDLLPVGVILRMLGAKVVYDIHEDIPKQVLHKYWIPKPARKLIAGAYGAMEKVAVRIFSHSFTVTQPIVERFASPKVSLVTNYPVPEELTLADAQPYLQRPPNILYVGGISEPRGIRELVAALDLLPTENPARLLLAGRVFPEIFLDQLRPLPGWKRVEFLGFQSRPDVARCLGRARVGMVTLRSTPNHLHSIPVKMFEYLAAGLPIIASDFPFWRSLLDKHNCALFVDPSKPAEISKAIQWILDHPDDARQMGERGIAAVRTEFNWETQVPHLVATYERLAQKK